MKDAKKVELSWWLEENADAEYNKTLYGRLVVEPDFELVEDNPLYQMLLEKMKQGRKEEVLSERTHKPAPDFTLVSLDGDSVSLSHLRGKPVFIDFWGLGCGPCQEAMPHLQRLYERHKEEMHLLGIETWGNESDKIAEYLKEQGITYPNLLGNEKVGNAYKIRGVPHLYVIDPEGNLAFSRAGFAGWWDMEEELGWYLEALQESNTGQK